MTLTILVVGCTNENGATTGNDITGNDSESVVIPTDLVSRLKSGDTTVCADPQVERTALTTIVDSSDLQSVEHDGGKIGPFDNISAIGVNKDVSEIACSASLKFNGESTYPFEYDVRPSLDQGAGIIVETKMSYGDRETLNKYVQIVLQGSWRQNEQQRTSAAEEPRANVADVEQAPEEVRPSEGVVDEDLKALQARPGSEPTSATAEADANLKPEQSPLRSSPPSFDCARARSIGALEVCSNPALASLDRGMAAEYIRAIAVATPGQLAQLRQTRTRFNESRNRCSTDACIRAAYSGRMREMSDIMKGN